MARSAAGGAAPSKVDELASRDGHSSVNLDASKVDELASRDGHSSVNLEAGHAARRRLHSVGSADDGWYSFEQVRASTAA